MDSNPVQAVTNALAAYLKTSVPSLKAVNKEWPDANVTVKYPSVTIMAGRTPLTNKMAEQIACTEPDEDGKVTATYVVGQYDYKIQLDLWCRTRPERETMLAAIIDAINAQSMDLSGKNNPLGLSLQLADYYDEWVHLDIDGHQDIDDEAGVQRQERRAKVDLLVNVRAIKQRTLYAMKKIEIAVGVGLDAAPLTPDDIGTEISEL